MKRLMLCAALLTASACFAQDELPVAPVEAIDLRLDMAANELEKSANWGDYSLYWGLFGSAFTALAYRDNETAGSIVGLTTIGGFYFMQLKSNGHKRKSAAHLRHTE